MIILGIDPGTTHTAVVVLDSDGRPTQAIYESNEWVLDWARHGDWAWGVAYIEMVASYGMPVGREVFETVYWTGRFCESLDYHCEAVRRLYRSEIKSHLCRSQRANDATIRQALLDRYGPGKDVAIGRKHAPGPLYGIKGDLWAALAVAVTGHDRERPMTPHAEPAGALLCE